jgi:hypothetical protein
MANFIDIGLRSPLAAARRRDSSNSGHLVFISVESSSAVSHRNYQLGRRAIKNLPMLKVLNQLTCVHWSQFAHHKVLHKSLSEATAMPYIVEP